MSGISSAAAVGQVYVDPLLAFHELASSRAYLWCIGEYELPEAVDALQANAIRTGLIERIGQDEIQRIMAEAFRPYQEAGHG
jgi:hypothetical protein